MNRDVPAEETASANAVQPGCRTSGLCQMEALYIQFPLEQEGQQRLLMKQWSLAVLHCTPHLLTAHGIIHMLVWYREISSHSEESSAP